MARKHSPRLLLKRTRAGEAIESPPFPSGGGNRGSGSRGWKTAGGLGLLALLDPIAAPPGDPQQMPETAVGHWLPGLPLPLVSEAGRALLPSRPRSPQCPRGKCFSSHEVGLGKGGVAFQGCPHVAAHGPGAGGTEGETGRDGSSFRVSGRQLASSKRPLHEGPGGWAAASPARGREAARLAGGPRAAWGKASAASGLHAMSAVCPRAALSLGFLSCGSPGAAGDGWTAVAPSTRGGGRVQRQGWHSAWHSGPRSPAALLAGCSVAVLGTVSVAGRGACSHRPGPVWSMRGSGARRGWPPCTSCPWLSHGERTSKRSQAQA